MSTKEIPARKDVPQENRWKLDSLYSSESAWESDFSRMKESIAAISGFRGSLGSSASALAACLAFMSGFGLLCEKLHEYAFLRQSEDEGDSAARERLSRFMMENARADGEAAWIEPEIQAIPDAKVSAWMETAEFADYRVYLKKLLRYKPHILSDKEERLLALQAEPNATAQSAFSVLTNVDFSFGTVDAPEGPVELSQTSLAWFLRHADRTVRERAFKKFYSVFHGHRHTLAQLYSGSVQLDRYQATVRNFSGSRARALFPDDVSESVYDNLVSTVNANLPALHRYYRLKKKALGFDELRHYDVYAPMVPGVGTKYSYEEAVETVAEALKPLGAEYVSTIRSGLIGGWVDRYENKGKRSGAFSSGSYSGQPFILMNYQEDVLRDLYTLAHEGGHSMHSHYSARNNPFLSYGYTIFEAEVASTFNEELLFKLLYAKADSDDLRAYLLNMRIDDTIGTLFRQTMFAEYEARCHALLEGGQPLTVDVLRSEYRSLLQKYFGPEMVFEEESDLEGLRIPHFYRAFYVYKYATGISAAMSLAERVYSGGEKERQDYFAFLKSGGSRFPIESLKLAGVDMSKPEPVASACASFAREVGELEKCLKLA
jgi:oligoendopeptidase F